MVPSLPLACTTDLHGDGDGGGYTSDKSPFVHT